MLNLLLQKYTNLFPEIVSETDFGITFTEKEFYKLVFIRQK